MECIFCQIVAGEIPAQKVHETDRLIVIRDINPHAPVHDLIISKAHIGSLNDLLDPEIAADILLVSKLVAEKEGIKDSGYRLIANTGKDAGQLVGHLHFHLLGGRDLGPKLVND